MDIFIEEIIFFGLTHYFVDVEAENEKEKAAMALLDEEKMENLSFRQKVWVCISAILSLTEDLFQITFENPASSSLGRIIASLSVFFILISTISFCLETLPNFKDEDYMNVTQFDVVNKVRVDYIFTTRWPQCKRAVCSTLIKVNKTIEVLAPKKKPWDPQRKSFPFWVTGMFYYCI